MAVRILILSASIGSGHVTAAKALESAFTSIEGDIVVRHEDALDFANPAFRNLYQKTYADLANNAPELLGWIYNYTERVWTTEEHGLALERWNSGSLKKVVKDYHPDLVVCTHPMPADMTSWLLCKKELETHHAIVLTDFEINPLWLCHHYSLYFVALEETKQHMLRLGYSDDRVINTGIPVHPKFSIEKDKTEMKIKHGLDPKRTTLLVSAGGAGLFSTQELIMCLSEVQSNTQIVALCGSNIELKDRLEQIAAELNQPGATPIHVQGYTTDMDEFMSAADLLIGKAGGLTSSEALAKRLPMVIVNPIPGQEERNSDHLLEQGCAIRCNNLPVLSYKITQVLADQAKLESMRESAGRMGRPRASFEIASALEKLAHEGNFPCAIHPAEHKCSGFMTQSLFSESNKSGKRSV